MVCKAPGVTGKSGELVLPKTYAAPLESIAIAHAMPKLLPARSWNKASARWGSIWRRTGWPWQNFPESRRHKCCPRHRSEPHRPCCWGSSPGWWSARRRARSSRQLERAAALSWGILWLTSGGAEFSRSGLDASIPVSLAHGKGACCKTCVHFTAPAGNPPYSREFDTLANASPVRRGVKFSTKRPFHAAFRFIRPTSASRCVCAESECASRGAAPSRRRIWSRRASSLSFLSASSLAFLPGRAFKRFLQNLNYGQIARAAGGSLALDDINQGRHSQARFTQSDLQRTPPQTFK